MYSFIPKLMALDWVGIRKMFGNLRQDSYSSHSCPHNTTAWVWGANRTKLSVGTINSIYYWMESVLNETGHASNLSSISRWCLPSEFVLSLHQTEIVIKFLFICIIDNTFVHKYKQMAKKVDLPPTYIHILFGPALTYVKLSRGTC